MSYQLSKFLSRASGLRLYSILPKPRPNYSYAPQNSRVDLGRLAEYAPPISVLASPQQQQEAPSSTPWLALSFAAAILSPHFAECTDEVPSNNTPVTQDVRTFESIPGFRQFIEATVKAKSVQELKAANLYTTEYMEECKKACQSGADEDWRGERLVRTMREKGFSVPTDGPYEGTLIQTDKKTGTVRVCVPIESIEKTIWFKHYGEKGHLRGIDKTWYAVRQHYRGIPRAFLLEYKKHCRHCQLDQRRQQDARIKPINVNLVWERHQGDLIDMRKFQCTHEGKTWRWIFHLRDHFSRWSFLLPLEQKTAQGVLDALNSIYNVWGPPLIFQSDNGKEFTAEALSSALKARWPKLQILNGRARHPQSQGSVERANAVVEELLRTLKRENASVIWADPAILASIAWAMNTTYCAPIKGTPYKCLFGFNPRLAEHDAVGVLSSDVVQAFMQEGVQDPATDERIEEPGVTDSGGSEDPSPSNCGFQSLEECLEKLNLVRVDTQLQDSPSDIGLDLCLWENEGEDKLHYPVRVLSYHSGKHTVAYWDGHHSVSCVAAANNVYTGNFSEETYSVVSKRDSEEGAAAAVGGATPDRHKRTRAAVSEANERSRAKIARVCHQGAQKKDYKLGDLVGVHVPAVDTNGIDDKFVVGVVCDIPHANKYKVWCNEGVLNVCYPAAKLEAMSEAVRKDLHVQYVVGSDDWKQVKQVALGTAARKASRAASDAFNTKKGCRCTTSKCKTISCPCRAAGLNCGSFCHVKTPNRCCNRKKFSV